MRTLVIVPTYNERENIGRLAGEILALPVAVDLLIVDDNSPDGTGKIAAEMAAANTRVQVLHREGKQGLGSAYRAGFRHGLKHGYDVLVTMDADFSHSPAQIPALAAAAERFDVVVGSRYVPGGAIENWPLSRQALSFGANVLARLIIARDVHDWTSGFRAYRAHVLRAIDFDVVVSNGYSFLVEMLFTCRRAGWRVGEVPIRFIDRRHGETKISRREIYRGAATLWRILRRRAPLPPGAGADERVGCNLCGVDDAIAVYPARQPEVADSAAYRCTSTGFRSHGRVVRCRGCGLVYINPRRDSGQVTQLYTEMVDPLYVAEVEGRHRTFSEALDIVRRFSSRPGRLLDVGCHIGVFVRLAEAAGWEAHGVEPSRWAADYARTAYGLARVTQGTLAEAGYADGTFDAVTMWDVLEHFTDPLGELREASRILRPGGVLVLTTIDIGSPIARLLGRRWWWLMEMHLYYFTRATLRSMLSRAGFETVELFTHTRRVSARYFLDRVGHLMPRLARPTRLAARVVPERWYVPVNFGDVVTVVVRKPLHVAPDGNGRAARAMGLETVIPQERA